MKNPPDYFNLRLAFVHLNECLAEDDLTELQRAGVERALSIVEEILGPETCRRLR